MTSLPLHPIVGANSVFRARPLGPQPVDSWCPCLLHFPFVPGEPAFCLPGITKSVVCLSVWTPLLWLLLAHPGVTEDRLGWLSPLHRVVPHTLPCLLFYTFTGQWKVHSFTCLSSSNPTEDKLLPCLSLVMPKGLG